MLMRCVTTSHYADAAPFVLRYTTASLPRRFTPLRFRRCYAAYDVTPHTAATLQYTLPFVYQMIYAILRRFDDFFDYAAAVTATDTPLFSPPLRHDAATS